MFWKRERQPTTTDEQRKITNKQEKKPKRGELFTVDFLRDFGLTGSGSQDDPFVISPEFVKSVSEDPLCIAKVKGMEYGDESLYSIFQSEQFLVKLFVILSLFSASVFQDELWIEDTVYDTLPFGVESGEFKTTFSLQLHEIFKRLEEKVDDGVRRLQESIQGETEETISLTDMKFREPVRFGMNAGIILSYLQILIRALNLPFRVFYH